MFQQFMFNFQGIKYLAHSLTNCPSTADRAAIKGTEGTHFVY